MKEFKLRWSSNNFSTYILQYETALVYSLDGKNITLKATRMIVQYNKIISFFYTWLSNVQIVIFSSAIEYTKISFLRPLAQKVAHFCHNKIQTCIIHNCILIPIYTYLLMCIHRLLIQTSMHAYKQTNIKTGILRDSSYAYSHIQAEKERVIYADWQK